MSDDWRGVAAATLRALAGQPGLQPQFARRPARESRQAGLARLPDPAFAGKAQVRGEIDAIGARLRHHDPVLHGTLAPESPVARRLFDSIEQARCEACGARRWPGVVTNLAAALRERSREETGSGEADQAIARLVEAVGLLAREALYGMPIPPAARDRIADFRPRIEPRFASGLAGLVDRIDDQRRFGALARELLLELDVAGLVDEGRPGDDGEEDDRAGRQVEPADGSSRAMGPGEIMDVEASRVESGDGAAGDTRTPAGARSRPPGGVNPTTDDGYRVWSVDFDSVVDADRLGTAGERASLRRQLDHQLEQVPPLAARQARRLQRRLMARHERRWEFDREEGTIDAARLTRVITNPIDPLLHKRETEARSGETVVSLLIDNSGSMRGRPIAIAAMSAEVILRTLEGGGVKVEILGFTTRAWKGGRCRERWVEAGMPFAPGRLNELAHIVYKSADQPWRRARRNLGVMLSEGLLKENIDGEALLWAHRRLLVRPERRRILVVISDGGPLDDATLAANDAGYLERHLRRVIGRIEARSPVELIAIGIGHDVSRWYRRATMIRDVGELGNALMARLAECLDARAP